MKRKKAKLPPYLKIIFTFVALVFIGSLLLWIPGVQKQEVSYIDCLYLSFSSSTATGLSSIGNITEYFNLIGIIIILILAEIGMMGFITIAMFLFQLFGFKLGLQGNILIKESLNSDSAKGLMSLLKIVIFYSLVIEIAFTGVYMFTFMPIYHNFVDSLAISAFEAISVYTQLGYLICSPEVSAMLSNDVFYNITTLFIMLSSSFGFILIYNIFQKRKWIKLSLTSKITLYMTIIMIVIGTLLVWVGDYKNLSVMNALFISTSARNFGVEFSNLNVSTMNSFNRIIIIVLMFIGGSPVSASGGVKVTTIFVIFVSIAKMAVGKEPVAFKRRIEENTIFKAFALISITIIYIVLILIVVTLIESSKGFTTEEIIFETVSALSTTGFSLGITSSLSIASKLIFGFTMLVGRIGPLSILSIFNKNYFDNHSELSYVEEKVVIG
jgi:trk system potassium uptake protein TrkH